MVIPAFFDPNVVSIFEENHQKLQLPELISKSLKKLGNKYE